MKDVIQTTGAVCSIVLTAGVAVLGFGLYKAGKKMGMIGNQSTKEEEEECFEEIK